MPNVFNPRLSILLLTLIFLLHCKQDDPEPIKSPEVDYMVYETGSGMIGQAGGEITLKSNTSEINGAYIKIPEGALESNKQISIKEAPEKLFYGDKEIPMVMLEPEGLIFKKDIAIGLPIKNNQSVEYAPYYFDSKDSSIIELPSLIQNNSFIETLTNHFSKYYAEEKNIKLDATLAIAGGKLAAQGIMNTSFTKIPNLVYGYSPSWVCGVWQWICPIMATQTDGEKE